MKKITITIAMLTLGAAITFAQTVKGKEQHKDGTQLDLKKDFDVASKGILKNANTIGLAKVSLHFKTITNESVWIGKGQTATSASTWAILDGVSEQTKQAIADEFATSFLKKLKEAGISSVDWNTVSSAPSFPKLIEKQIDKTFQNKNEGLMEIYTANNGPHTKQIVGNPGIWGALAKVGKDIKANTVTMDIIIDFANFDMSMKKSGYYTTKISANAKVHPQISIQAMNGATGFGMMQTNFTTVGKYGEATIVSLKKNISFEDEYATSVDSYNGKMPTSMQKKISWGSNMTTGTFMITADEQKYKKAVLKALDVYSDYLIEIVKSVKG